MVKSGAGDGLEWFISKVPVPIFSFAPKDKPSISPQIELGSLVYDLWYDFSEALVVCLQYSNSSILT